MDGGIIYVALKPLAFAFSVFMEVAGLGRGEISLGSMLVNFFIGALRRILKYRRMPVGIVRALFS